ncbi:MAG: DUF1800 domain-containing protein [Novosphingobium sp.]|nr:DUF1800 domain-containing protein [Novosphingobium sp.]
MAETSIALNRFGLGARAGQPSPGDPKRWLLDQFGRFDPRPAPIAGLPAAATLIGMLRDARDERKDRKSEAKANRAEAAAPGKRTGAMPAPFRDLREQYVSAVGARTAAALASDTPFVERLVHFWANHFAISVDKIAVVGLAGAFEFEAIRPHVLGSFGAMLRAVERHPAMLLYLDQAQSIGPGSRLGARAAQRGRERGLNENLAREILELHTLGVRSGYSQGDVTEFARALTGWTVGGLGRLPALQGSGPGFTYAEPIHEPGARTILGKRYGQQGEGQAQAVLDDLAVHPATARHIATKLARHFAADEPPPALVSRLERAFLSSGGDLPSVYRALIEAPEPWSSGPKFRTPWEWAIGALRGTGVTSLPGATAAGAFQQLGQAVWKPGSPAGYDDVAPSWAGPDALYRRIEVAQRIATRAATVDARQLAGQLFPGALSEATRSAIERAESGQQALALLLAAPEMMRR